MLYGFPFLRFRTDVFRHQLFSILQYPFSVKPGILIGSMPLYSPGKG